MKCRMIIHREEIEVGIRKQMTYRVERAQLVHEGSGYNRRQVRGSEPIDPFP